MLYLSRLSVTNDQSHTWPNLMGLLSTHQRLLSDLHMAWLNNVRNNQSTASMVRVLTRHNIISTSHRDQNTYSNLYQHSPTASQHGKLFIKDLPVLCVTFDTQVTFPLRWRIIYVTHYKHFSNYHNSYGLFKVKFYIDKM